MIRDLRPRFIVTEGRPTDYGGRTINLTRIPGEFIPRIPRNKSLPRPPVIQRPDKPLMNAFGMERK